MHPATSIVIMIGGLALFVLGADGACRWLLA
jgi:hypothetical protein